MPYVYRGYNGSIAMGTASLEISRGWLIAKSLGLGSRKQVILLTNITGLTCQRPTVLLNGYVRIGVRGNDALPLTPREANGHPHAVTFHHGQRREFDKLVSELQRVVTMNQSIGNEASNGDASANPAGAVSHIPRTDQELADVVSFRPPFWEYRLFAGLLLAGLDKLEDKWHDHEFRYAKMRTHLEDAQQAASRLSEIMSRAGGLAGGIERLLTSRNTELAFGPPGTPGDPNRIKILASRLVEIYEGFLDVAVDLRSTAVVEELQETFELAAQLMDEPLSNMRDFVNRTAVEIEKIIDLSERDKLKDGHELTLELTLTINDGAMRDYNNSFERARKRLKI